MPDAQKIANRAARNTKILAKIHGWSPAHARWHGLKEGLKLGGADMSRFNSALGSDLDALYKTVQGLQELRRMGVRIADRVNNRLADRILHVEDHVRRYRAMIDLLPGGTDKITLLNGLAATSRIATYGPRRGPRDAPADGATWQFGRAIYFSNTRAADTK